MEIIEEDGTMNFDRKIKLRDKIEQLNETEQKEVFRIFHNNKIEFSENNNGIFINLKNISNEILFEIEKYIKHLSIIEKEIIDIEDQKNQFKETFFN